MDSQDKIDIGTTSSLVDLKAELIKKQRELQESKRSRGVPKSLTKTQGKNIAKGKTNKGIESRIARDLEEHDREAKTHEKSKLMLVAKAKLYDQMQAEALTHDEHSHPVLMNSLVNFQEKAIEDYFEKKSSPMPSKSGDGDELVEFIDTLGRTRKCRRSELALAIAKDEQLARDELLESAKRIESGASNISGSGGVSGSESVGNRSWGIDTVGSTGTYAAVPPPTALNLSKILTEEQVAEMKHKKWEEETEKAADKDAVHYQDVMFDEIRTHGVGYFQFATDDEKRAEQILELKKLSDQTKAVREKVTKERSQKAGKLKERLKKVRARKRARLGLPPKESSSSDEEHKEEEEVKKNDSDEDEAGKVGEDFSGGIDEIKNKLLRGSVGGREEMRPWDYGKPGVYGPKPINFDELDAKWLMERRMDRKSEFAPPSAYNYKDRPASFSSSRSSGSSFKNVPPPSADSSFSKYGNFVRAKPPPVATATGPEPSASTKDFPPRSGFRNEESMEGVREEGMEKVSKDSHHHPGVGGEGKKHFLDPEKRQTKIQFSLNRPTAIPQKPIPIHDELPAPVADDVEAERKRGLGTEIPPPATFQYFHGGSTAGAPSSRTSHSQIEDSVSAGLRALREQFERKQEQK